MGGDPQAPPPNESTAQMLRAYSENLPELLRVTAAGIGPYEQALTAAQQQTSPAQAALQAELYKTYGPMLNNTANDINNTNQLAQAQTDLNVIQGPGRGLVTQGLETQKILDPEFYATRTATANRLGDLLQSINLGGQISPGEQAQLSRGLAQQDASRGIQQAPSQTAALSNALTFGNAQHQRETESKNQLATALQTANQTLPALKSGQDAFQIATGRSSTGNSGDNKFTGVDTNVGQQSTSIANGLLGATSNLTQQANDINANRRDSLDRINQTLGGVGSLI